MTGRHAADDDEIGIDKQLRITSAVQELRYAVRDIHPERRVQFLAHVYAQLVDEWERRDELG